MGKISREEKLEWKSVGGLPTKGSVRFYHEESAKTMVKLNIIAPLEKALTKMQIRYEIFDDTVPEPTAKSIKKNLLENGLMFL